MLSVKTPNDAGAPVKDYEIKVPGTFVLRKQVRFLEERLTGRGIEIIQGSRHAGKTTVAHQLMLHLLLKKQVSPRHIVYIPCEWFKEAKWLADPLLFCENIRSITGTENVTYLFFDGMASVRNPLSFFSRIIEHHPFFKVVACADHKIDVPENMVALDQRNMRITNLYPISTVEWAGFHDGQLIEEVRKNIYSSMEKGQLTDIKMMDRQYGAFIKERFYETALFGGYPRVLLVAREKRFEEIENIYTAFFEPRALSEQGIDKPELIKQLFKVLSSQVDRLVNFSELSDLLKASPITIKKYHASLTNNFLLYAMGSLKGKKSGEIKQAQKSFFGDSGILNLVSEQRRNHILATSANGITNALCGELIKNLNYKNKLLFWQTNTGTNVDFVVESGKKFLVPIVIKFGEARPKKLTRSLHSFIKTYKPQRAIFVNESLIDHDKVSGTEVLYLPYYWVPVLEGLWQ